jgi:hypothetical protein
MRTLFQANEQTRVALLESDAEKEALLTLFEAIAKEQGWQPGQELRAYPQSAIYFALMIGEQPIGGLQLIVGQRSGKERSPKASSRQQPLPFLTVWPELVSEAKTPKHSGIADIALLALRSEYRGQRDLFWLLCIEMWRYCTQHSIQTLWVEVTPAKLQLYRRLGWPLQIAGPLRLHWGEECYPCWMSAESVAQAVADKATRSPHYQHLLDQAYRKEPVNGQAPLKGQAPVSDQASLKDQASGKNSAESDSSGRDGNCHELNHRANTTSTCGKRGAIAPKLAADSALPFVA